MSRLVKDVPTWPEYRIDWATEADYKPTGSEEQQGWIMKTYRSTDGESVKPIVTWLPVSGSTEAIKSFEEDLHGLIVDAYQCACAHEDASSDRS